MTLWGQTMSAPTCIFAVKFSSASLAFSEIICYNSIYIDTPFYTERIKLTTRG